MANAMKASKAQAVIDNILCPFISIEYRDWRIRTNKSCRTAIGTRRRRRLRSESQPALGTESELDNLMASGTNMDAIEIVVYTLLVMWGPPLLPAAFLLRLIRSAASRPER